MCATGPNKYSLRHNNIKIQIAKCVVNVFNDKMFCPRQIYTKHHNDNAERIVVQPAGLRPVE